MGGGQQNAVPHLEAPANVANRALSNLRYDRIQDGTGTPRIITIHDYDETSTGQAKLAQAVAPSARIIGLESYKGVYVGRHITGYTWYLGPIDRPAPIFFGDSLAEIERFLWDEVDRQQTDRPELPYLLGVRQGAVMALAAALATPDLLSGVIAVEGALPLVPGWDPPLAPLAGLPVLILGDLPVTSEAPVLRGPELVGRLEEWGGAATWVEPATTQQRDRMMVDWLAAQTPRTGSPAIEL